MAAVLRLKAWQSDRLARTYPDLLGSPRYHDAARFFLDEMYGAKDFSQRDEDVERILPKLTALLPATVLSAIADAVELDELSETLDQAVTHAHNAANPAAAPVTEASYAAAYRTGSQRSAREHQIRLTHNICQAVDQLTHIPLLLTTLKMMRAPARIAGLSELQRFLESGFVTFKGMQGADEFIDIISRRETLLMERLFAGVPAPFSHPLLPAAVLPQAAFAAYRETG